MIPLPSAFSLNSLPKAAALDKFGLNFCEAISLLVVDKNTRVFHNKLSTHYAYTCLFENLTDTLGLSCVPETFNLTRSALLSLRSFLSNISNTNHVIQQPQRTYAVFFLSLSLTNLPTITKKIAIAEMKFFPENFVTGGFVTS
jgi:hypothetical protein